MHEAGGLRVRAFAVEHADGNPALGYRVERAGRVVALSGDATLSDGLVEGARGADLLVQNIIAFSPRLSAMPEMQGVLAKLTTPEQAAQLIMAAAPGLTVFSPYREEGTARDAGDAIILERVRAAGARGRIAMGHDREIVEIGAGGHAPAAAPHWRACPNWIANRRRSEAEPAVTPGEGRGPWRRRQMDPGLRRG